MVDLSGIVGAPGVLPNDPGRNRLLVVEDEMAQRMMMLRLLKRAGFECAAASSTSEARSLLAKGPFGVLITDLRMFNEDGIELVRYTKDRYPDTFIIVVTGFADDETAARVKRAGAFEILSKPIEPAHLTTLVERAFEERGAAVALRRHKSG